MDTFSQPIVTGDSVRWGVQSNSRKDRKPNAHANNHRLRPDITHTVKDRAPQELRRAQSSCILWVMEGDWEMASEPSVPVPLVTEPGG